MLYCVCYRIFTGVSAVSKDKLELIYYNNDELLEGPCWVAQNNVLFFVSIKADTVLCMDVTTGKCRSYHTDGAVGCVVIRDDNMITAEKSGIYITNLNTLDKQRLCHVYDDPAFRYNDGKLDPRGRFFVGTLGDGKRLDGGCALYRIDGKDNYKQMLSNVTISNGLGWTGDCKTMYYIDTPTSQVAAFDYDLKNGEMSNRRVVATIDDGFPDGMCVDIDDTCYIAHWGGGKVSHWDLKKGIRLDEIHLPVTNVSSCCIGGENMDTLFITTAKCEKDEEYAGGLFKIKIR